MVCCNCNNYISYCMKYLTLFKVFFIIFIANTDAQNYKYKSGQKAEGGIVIIASKKSGVVVAEKVLGMMTWEDGKKACEDLVLNGYDNWRLPTMNELYIFYYEFYLKGVGDFPTGNYWSKKENTGIRELGWSFNFKDGSERNSNSKANTNYILPVRSY